MKIVVCIKQIPRPDAKIEWTGTAINRAGVAGIMNPNDKIAVALALGIKAGGDEVISLTMGPPNAEDSLRETIAMGVDRAILLTDPKFAGADTLATSYSLHMAIKKIGDVDVVICGSRAADAETGHVGFQLAEFLGIPVLSYVTKFSIKGKTVAAERICDRHLESIESSLPALITVSHRLFFRVYPSLSGLNRAFGKAGITIWDADAIGADPKRIGTAGSATFVERILTPEKQRKAVILNDEKSDETISRLLELLKNRNILLLDKIRSRRGIEGSDL